MHVLARLNARAVEDAVVHRLVGWATLEVVRVAGICALASTLHGVAWKLAGIPERRAVEVLLVLRGLPGATREVEAVAERCALTGRQIRNANGVVARVRTYGGWDGKVDWRGEACGVLEVAY